MFCKNCGTENSAGARFCEQCGAAVQAEAFGRATFEANTDAQRFAQGPGVQAKTYTDAQRFAQGPGAQQYRSVSSQYASVEFGQKISLLEAYTNMWKNYANFRDRTRTRGYWLAVLCNVIAELALYIIMIVGATAGSSGLMGFAYVLIVLYGLAVMCPGLALSIRRLRDAGRPWPWIFISLIPFVGTIVLIVVLCGHSVPDDGTRVV